MVHVGYGGIYTWAVSQIGLFVLLTSFEGVGLCKEQIMVGSGMLLPPLGDNDTTPFDTADAETFEYLKQRQH